jgi:hypothetical protein
MNATNLAEQLTFQMGSTIRESMTRNLQMVEESGKRTGREVMLHVNHPNYKWGVTAEDLAAVVGERFFEVWNGVDGDNDPGDATRPGTDAIWDTANTLRITQYSAPPLYGLATDDSHNHHGNKTHSPPGRAWVMVRARHLTPESIVRALRAGEFYSSTGVELEDVSFVGKRLALKIVGKGNERFVTRFIGGKGRVLAEVAGLTPSYEMKGGEMYVRAVVTSTGVPEVASDEFGFKRAWTQPVGW